MTDKIFPLTTVTEEWLRNSVKSLFDNNVTCCYVTFDKSANHRISVCVGWTKVEENQWQVAWKIGWQKFDNIMQCDFDVDFDMPHTAEGGVYDTEEIILTSYNEFNQVDWNRLAIRIRETARDAAAFAKEIDK